MYVCVCHAVNETRIREACQKGASSLQDLSRELGVARGCGQCAEHARQTIDTFKNETAPGFAAS